MRRIETLAAGAANVESYLRTIAKFPRLSSEEERELGRRIQQREDHDALGTLVEANLRYVVSYARRYRTLGVPLLDLIREGNLGLLEGARRFDPNRTETFIEHAAWWVRQSMMHLLSDDVSLMALRLQLEHAPALGHTSDEEAERIDDGHRDVGATGALPARRQQRREREPLAGLAMQEIEDDRMRDALVQQLEGALREVDPLARQVIRLRYGLHGHESLSISLIAERMRLTRERVRMLEARGVQKLRRGKSLRSYLN